MKTRPLIPKRYKTFHGKNKTTKIETGFADGFPRPWYKNGHISYKGEIYDIAGRVCMDQFMVDFGDMEPRLGDEVLIFGKKDDDHISLESISKNLGRALFSFGSSLYERTAFSFNFEFEWKF